MMRSMFSGVSSLRAHQLRMDVIGNNIANVNTVGYKASSVSFSETFSQTLQGASSSSAARGGTNPKQVGLGTTVAAISVNHTRGSIQRTDVATDLMIDGNGFFMVTNDANAQNKFYTRAGNFAMDERGFLVTADGMKVLDQNFKPIQVNMSDTVKAQSTKNVILNGNINVNDEFYNSTVDLYDSLGAVHTMNIRLGENEFVTMVPQDDDRDPMYPDGDADARNYSLREITFEHPNLNPNEITAYAIFNESGEIVDLIDEATYLAFNDGDAMPAGLGAANVAEIAVPGASVISFPLNRSMFFANGDPESGVRIFSQYSQESDAKGVQIAGNSAGTIDTFNISSKGEVVGIYTNGERKIIQTIGLVDFDNPAGLMKIGGNLFQDTPNSGTPKFGSPASGSFGAIAAGALEMSNVDIAAQFTDMITTQRGFQANSRVISTSDEILQELVNLKR